METELRNPPTLPVAVAPLLLCVGSGRPIFSLLQRADIPENAGRVRFRFEIPSHTTVMMIDMRVIS
jgi:hypothetical protein